MVGDWCCRTCSADSCLVNFSKVRQLLPKGGDSCTAPFEKRPLGSTAAIFGRWHRIGSRPEEEQNGQNLSVSLQS
jgi:hypothetical protein